jgi:hypothetical protein
MFLNENINDKSKSCLYTINYISGILIFVTFKNIYKRKK